MDYSAIYQQSIEQPEQFWGDQAKRIDWFTPPTEVLKEVDANHYRWFKDGELNTSYLALDYHVANGRGEQVAIYYDSPVTNTKRAITYSELLEQVNTAAGMLQQLGVTKGDRVLIYMPMIPEAAVAMLACARIGAIHSVVFGGFAPNELSVRIDDAAPKVILSTSCGVELNKVLPYQPLVEQALALATAKPEVSVFVERPELALESSSINRIEKWHELMATARPTDPIAVKSTDPLYILYTSGTTGKPKGVVRDNGGHAVAMHYSMETVYGMKPGETFWAASDVGWVVGHSYIVYAPLIYGCSTVMYEGKPIKTPDAGAFWRVCQDYQVTALFTAPTAFRAIRQEDPKGDLMANYDLSSLKRFFLAGERLDPATYHWLHDISGKPVLDHWWQTETGWAIACNPVGIKMVDTKSGSASFPTPGYNVQILRDDGSQAAPGEQGLITVKLPLPPGTFPTLWQDDERYCSSYLSRFDGYYLSGDGGYIDEDGYLFVMGRVDDVINVAGHRLSTGEMEEIVANHSSISECAVVGVNEALKGEVPVTFVVCAADADHQQVDKELVNAVRQQIGPIACMKEVIHVARLPKTRSGKILRRTLRQIYQNDEYAIPSTIDDAAVLDEIKQQLDNY
ncbi:MAG: propionyl-CoA synthetase [Kangiellaceae bacterium]|jgi:propionyl-CoA synthetase|nr:propionyl-CoA synthetase [Kangiellaceae bacterium]